MKDTIEAFRRFNRFYTRLLGLFNRRLLGSPLNLTEARTLFEIVASPGVPATELSRALGMDRGQLSQFMIHPLGPPAQHRTPASFSAYWSGGHCCA